MSMVIRRNGLQRKSRVLQGIKVAAAPFVLGVLYLSFWPVKVDPVGWIAPENQGFTGPFEENTTLGLAQQLPLGGREGPEDAVVGPDGKLYVSTRGGPILRYEVAGDVPEVFVDTQGSPLGLDFDAAGRLIVADAYRGLLAVTPDQVIQVLTTESDGEPIAYADAVAVAPDGKIYFTDASTKFGAEASGGSYEASLLDIMEHGGHGRLLEYDPATKRTTTITSGLQFANGVALTPDGAALVVETGSYRIVRIELSGFRRGKPQPVLENLPGFPDNLRKGRDGRYWVGLVSPRSRLLDFLSDRPAMRKVAQRLPPTLRPKPAPYGHVFAINAQGKVLTSLQDPDGAYSFVTGAIETDQYLFVTSLKALSLARLPREGLKLPSGG